MKVLGGQVRLLFTAQPEAPAQPKAGASGWAVNDQINGFPHLMVKQKLVRRQQGP